MTAPIMFQQQDFDPLKNLAPLLAMLQHRKQLALEQQRIGQEAQRIQLLERQISDSEEMDVAQKKQIKSQIDERTAKLEADQNAHAGANLAAGIVGQLNSLGLKPGAPAQPSPDGKPGPDFNMAAIQELGKHASKPYYGALVENFNKLVGDQIDQETKLANEEHVKAADLAVKQGKALEVWKESGGKVTLGQAMRSAGVDTKQFDPQVLAQRSEPTGSFSLAGVAPGTGNAVTLNQHTGRLAESAQPVQRGTAVSIKAQQEKITLAARQAFGAISAMQAAVRDKDNADYRSPMSALASGVASYTGKGEAGSNNATDARNMVLEDGQVEFQRAANQLAHSVSGLLGGQRSIYLYNSLLGTYNPPTGSNKEKRLYYRQALAKLKLNVIRLMRGDMSALNEIDGLTPSDAQEIMNAGLAPTGANPLDAGMAPDIGGPQ